MNAKDLQRFDEKRNSSNVIDDVILQDSKETNEEDSGADARGVMFQNLQISWLRLEINKKEKIFINLKGITIFETCKASNESQIRASYRVIIDMHFVGNSILDYDIPNLSLIAVTARTANQDYQTLLALKNKWQNTPPDCDRSNDPCGDGWVGIGCINRAVTSVTLASMSLSGQLSSDIGGLSELRILDLSYNKNLTGPLPMAIGNLRKLTNLILADCGFNGVILDTIGNLQRLAFL
ncbi:hypothetical protein PIB30_072055 [Stylosanthes scabra]|uniref:Leucine-rich repeat-containing N-terminal plant-type domain-containing protein n=1 Tax=Stylosanthes scabra TaxID=79078 RepID=A0ABU6YNC8_9FABA|nr:hypothetical protein [Stylosanthes scabra]